MQELEQRTTHHGDPGATRTRTACEERVGQSGGVRGGADEGGGGGGGEGGAARAVPSQQPVQRVRLAASLQQPACRLPVRRRRAVVRLRLAAAISHGAQPRHGCHRRRQRNPSSLNQLPTNCPDFPTPPLARVTSFHTRMVNKQTRHHGMDPCE